MGSRSPAKSKISCHLQILHFTSWQNTVRCLFRGNQRVNVIFCRCLQSCHVLLLWALCWSLRPSDDKRTLQRADRRTASVRTEAGEPGIPWSEERQDLPLLSFQHLLQLISRQVIHKHAQYQQIVFDLSERFWRIGWCQEAFNFHALAMNSTSDRMVYWWCVLIVYNYSVIGLFSSSILKTKTRRSLFLSSLFYFLKAF